jgi:hypothetical protein
MFLCRQESHHEQISASASGTLLAEWNMWLGVSYYDVQKKME